VGQKKLEHLKIVIPVNNDTENHGTRSPWALTLSWHGCKFGGEMSGRRPVESLDPQAGLQDSTCSGYDFAAVWSTNRHTHERALTDVFTCNSTISSVRWDEQNNVSKCSFLYLV